MPVSFGLFLPVDTTAFPASEDLKTDRISVLPLLTAARNS